MSSNPRSHACITCRRRKVKCDEGKPHCRRCVLRGTQCDGYDSQPDRDAKAQQALVKRWRPGSSRIDDDNSQSIRKLQHVFTVSRGQASTAPAPAPQQNRSLESTANEQHIIDLFVHDYMPTGHGSWRDQCPWLFEILAKQDPILTPTLTASLRAVALIRVGRLRNDDAMLVEARELYVSALSGLQRLIAEDTPQPADSPIFSARALSIYEVVEHSHSFAWLKHQQGLEALITSRGADEYLATASKNVFWGLKDASMMKAIVLREKSSLDLPTGNESLISSPLDVRILHSDLRTIGTFFAGVLANCNHCVEQAEQCLLSLEQAELCWQGLSECADMLNDWHSRRESMANTFLYKTHIDQSDSAASETRLPHDRVEFRFPNLFDATTMMVYWALELLLDCLTEEYSELTGVSYESPSPNERTSRRFILLANIFRSLAPLTGKDTGILGGSRCVFPWDVAMGMLKKMDGPIADDLFRRGRDAHSQFLHLKGMRIVGQPVDVRQKLDHGERLLLTGKLRLGEPLYLNWHRPEKAPCAC